MVVDVFGNFWNVSLELYLALLPVSILRFLTVPELAWQEASKKTKVKLHLLIDVNLLLMVKKSVRERICNKIHQCVKANNKYVKDQDYEKQRIIKSKVLVCD